MQTPHYSRSLFAIVAFVMSMGLAIADGDKPSINDSPSINKTLASIESSSENMVDAILLKDMPHAQKSYAEIKSNIDVLHTWLDSHPFDERRSREVIMAYSWLRVISVDLKQQAWVGAAIASNQLNASMIRFMQYPNADQRDIAWLDYLGREVLLLNMENADENAELLMVRLADLMNTWSRIKLVLIKDFRNKPLLIKGDELIRRLNHSKSPMQYIDESNNLLSFIKKIEQVTNITR